MRRPRTIPASLLLLLAAGALLAGDGASVLRQRPVEVDRDRWRLAPARETLRLDIRPFDDLPLTLELRARDADRRGWTGRTLEPTPGRALLSERDGAWQLNLWLDDGRLLELRGSADGAATAIEYDPSAFEPCGVAGHAIDVAPADEPSPERALAAPGCVDDGSVFDVLVAYTAGARAAQGGTAAMLALIDQAEASVNQAYADSQIPLTLNVVHTVEVAYGSSGTAFTDLDRLLNPFDGFLDSLHPLRDDVRADTVSLIVNNFDKCGLAELAIAPGNSPRPAKAFNVIERDCAVPQFVFAHENAHNQGSLHDRGQNPGVTAGAYPYSYAYNGGSFRTIMVASSGGTRINQFSNPDVLQGGQPTGVPTTEPDSAHNALSLTSTAYNVSRFRCSLFDCNGNGVEDADDVAAGTSDDCNTNQVPDECETDCNGNGIPDNCDVNAGTSDDCNGDLVPDECELPTEDCNGNGQVDECDLAGGASTDCNGNGLPDECESDCNGNGIEDSCDLASGTSFDCQGNGAPDECDTSGGAGDADADGVPDVCQDCDGNGTLDSTDVAGGQLSDADGDGIPDECARVRNATRGRQHATIQLALDASFDGDTIEAGPGVYNELVDFLGREVTLRSTDGAAATTIDGSGLNGSVVTMDDLEDSATVLDGFRLTGGQGTALPGGDSGGGGIHAPNALDALIVNCDVDDNRADLGAGIYVGGGGGALQLRNVVLRDNRARKLGGAIYVETGFDTVDVSQATIVGNIAPQGGSALSVPNLGVATVVNSIVRGNNAPALTGGAVVEHSNVEGLGGGTNIDDDPLFVDQAGGDLRLDAGSPCLDAGDQGSLPADLADVDLDGDRAEPLPLDLDREPRSIGVVDMGAFERQPALPPPPIPDGTNGSQPLTAARLDPAGGSIELTWDDGCPQEAVHLLYGSLGQVASWSVDGSVCDPATPHVWSGVPAGDLWFVVVGRDDAGVEGSWGLATGGQRGGGVSGACGTTARQLAGVCP